MVIFILRCPVKTQKCKNAKMRKTNDKTLVNFILNIFNENSENCKVWVWVTPSDEFVGEVRCVCEVAGGHPYSVDPPVHT